MSLTTIVSTRRDEDSALMENVFLDLHSRDEELRTQPIHLDFPEETVVEAATPDGVYGNLLTFS